MRQYVIDAFTDHVFAGNPAAVCLMDRWLGEAKMMAITIENNRSETAFAVREGGEIPSALVHARRRDRPVRPCHAWHRLRDHDVCGAGAHADHVLHALGRPDRRAPRRSASNDEITREQLATMLYEYARYKGYDVTKAADLSGFADQGSVSAFAVDRCSGRSRMS